MTDRYESPLSSRYASKYMLNLFSAETRIRTWRKLWVSLAKAEHALGLPVSQEQVEELEAHINEIDFEAAAAREKEVRGDDVYAGRIARSVAKMEKDEHRGMPPAIVGKLAARAATKKWVKPLYAVRFDYKAIALLAKLLPASLLMPIVARQQKKKLG